MGKASNLVRRVVERLRRAAAAVFNKGVEILVSDNLEFCCTC
jgi:hypothetical protein